MGNLEAAKFRLAMLVLGASLAVVLSSCRLCDPAYLASLTDPPGLAGVADGCPAKARVCEKPTVRALAHDLDELERHIERNGSVVVQHPSVWGQARLTKHREDFERQMFLELGNFHATLQGSLSRSDQAFFANALALSAAVSSPAAVVGPPGKVVVANSTSSNAVAPTTLTPPAAEIPTDAFAAFTAMSRTGVRAPLQVGFAGIAQGGVALEPTVYLNQKARYLNHLNELRRINEGDDTADSPGYSLNLVRIPVSVLPGKRTDQGYGAEVTMTLTPYLSEELLPTTFRNLVINDLVQQASVTLTEVLNDDEGYVYLGLESIKARSNSYGAQLRSQGMPEKEIEAAVTLFEKDEEDKLRETPQGRRLLHPKHPDAKQPVKQPDVMKPRPEDEDVNVLDAKRRFQTFKATVGKVPPIKMRQPPSVPATKMRRARLPFPPSQTLAIYDLADVLKVAVAAYDAFREQIPNKDWVHLPDVESFLSEELSAAYKLLARFDNAHLWEAHCTPHLVTAIRSHQNHVIEDYRRRFLGDVETIAGRAPSQDTTLALSWAIIVESALLTDHLIQDMREAASAKGCPKLPEHWLPYYLPCPPPDARMAFNEYVRCRWPLIVFALDPVTDQQNIADVFSQRREMQLAMSLAFVSGQINAKNMMRYARRIEHDIETIALNNTSVGFSHGNDTFGWRFYPRFQTPEIESNATVFFRDLMVGGPSRDVHLKQRRLEPGQRECVAIVMMPSFVPYASLESSSNWISLTNPKHKQMTSTDAVKLSAQVKAIQNCVPLVGDAVCYRDGELMRLVAKAKQLEARLPLQNMQVQIPYENTLGGFAMFSTGITDLAPELLGWYGAPGINLDASTTIFLIGNHLSVHQTRVVAGGLPVPLQDMEMLSRQVMRVTIPQGALAIREDNGRVAQCKGEGAAKEKAGLPPRLFVDVHLATPYGVTSHLLIPACHTKAEAAAPKPPPPPAEAAWSAKTVHLAYVYKGLGIAASEPPIIRPADLRIDIKPPIDTRLDTADLKMTVEAKDAKLKATIALQGLLVRNNSVFFTDAKRDELVAKIFDKIGRQFGQKDKLEDLAITRTDITLKQGAVGVMTLAAAANPLPISWVPAAEPQIRVRLEPPR